MNAGASNVYFAVRPAMTTLVMLVALMLVQAGAALAQQDSAGWIPLATDDGLLTLEVGVNGEQAILLLDSGTPGNAITRQLVESAGIDAVDLVPQQDLGSIAARSTTQSGKFEMTIGDSSFDMDGFPIVEDTGNSASIVIGRGFFMNVGMQIDYPNRRMRLLNADTLEFEGNMEMRLGGFNEPQVKASIGDEEVWMILDTGNGGLCRLSRRFVQGNDYHDEYPAGEALYEAHGIDKSGTRRLLELPSLKLGPYRFNKFLSTYDTDSEAGIDVPRFRHGTRVTETRMQADGVLGYEILRNFMVTLNMQDRNVHVYVPQ